MQKNIFETGNNKCYLFYEDYLVANLDMTQLDDCMAELTNGRPYNLKPSFWKPSTEKKIKKDTCLTFILNREFEARCRINGGECFVSQNGETFKVENGKFGEWIAMNLLERGYAPFKKPVHQLFFAGEILLGAVLIAIALLLIIYGSDLRFISVYLGSDIIMCIALIIHGLKHIKTGDTEITYYKVK